MLTSCNKPGQHENYQKQGVCKTDMNCISSMPTSAPISGESYPMLYNQRDKQ